MLAYRFDGKCILLLFNHWPDHYILSICHDQSGTKPKLVTSGHGLPKLVANISSQFHHLVKTGLDVGSIVKWLLIKVDSPSKMDKFEWFIARRLRMGPSDCNHLLTHYALWNFTSNGVGHFSELDGTHAQNNEFVRALQVNFLEKLPKLVALQNFQSSYLSCGESLNHNTLSHYY